MLRSGGSERYLIDGLIHKLDGFGSCGLVSVRH